MTTDRPVSKLRELVEKWRRECPQGIIGPFSQALRDCADELESALSEQGEAANSEKEVFK